MSNFLIKSVKYISCVIASVYALSTFMVIFRSPPEQWSLDAFHILYGRMRYGNPPAGLVTVGVVGYASIIYWVFGKTSGALRLVTRWTVVKVLAFVFVAIFSLFAIGTLMVLIPKGGVV